MNDIKIRIPQLERTWARCTYCGAKSVIIDNTTECRGVYIRCSRGCKRVFELIVHNGVQENSSENTPRIL